MELEGVKKGFRTVVSQIGFLCASAWPFRHKEPELLRKDGEAKTLPPGPLDSREQRFVRIA